MRTKKEPLAGLETEGANKAGGLSCQSNLSTRNSQDSSTEAQELRLLKRLLSGPVTTFFARKQLDIPHPAGRVLGLRQKGYDIETVMVDDYSQAGQVHRVALYSLKRG